LQMTEQEKLKDMYDTFSFDVIEDYKMTTLLIKKDSSIVSLFSKKHYDEIIEQLRAQRKISGGLHPDKLKPESEVDRDIVRRFSRALDLFNLICDSQIKMQELLQAKAERKKKVYMSDASEVRHTINEKTDELKKALRELDIRWADFLDEMDEMEEEL
jgi:hypothetical protein